MALAFKTKNFIAASYIARRFLKLTEDNPGLVEDEVKGQAQKILTASEKKGTNEFASLTLDEQLLYDENVTSKIDAEDLTVLTKADSVKLCPLDKAAFKAKHAGKVCSICQTCQVGKETIGMKIVR